MLRANSRHDQVAVRVVSENRVSVQIGANVSLSTSGVESLDKAKEAANAASAAVAGIGGVSEDAAARMLAAFEQMNQRLNGLAGQPGAPSSPFARASGILDTAAGGIAGARFPSDLNRAQAQISKAQEYAQQAAAGGADPAKLLERIKELSDRLEAARKATEGNTIAVRSGGGGGNGGNPNDPNNPSSPGFDWGRITRGIGQAQGALGQGLGGNVGGLLGSLGGLGGLARFAGPLAAVGAGVGAFDWLTNALTATNKDFRDANTANADLARQYGYSGDPETLFRSKNGLTDPSLMRIGYSAIDAARVAGQYDGRPGMRGDVRDMLTFSRNTGMDEGRTASTAQALYRTGTFQGAGAAESLMVLKGAMRDGLKEGIAQSEIMRSIQSITESNFRRGITGTQTSLAFNASMLEQLARTGNRALQGESGAAALEKMNAGLTGAGDMGMQMLAMNNLGEFKASDLGLEGAEAEQFERLRKRSPMQARKMALKFVRSGRSPMLLKRLASNLESQLGGKDSVLYDAVLENFDLSADQRLSIESGGGAGLYQRGFENKGQVRKGERLDKDVQANNEIEKRSRVLTVTDADTKYLTDRAKFELTGGFEDFFRTARHAVARALLGGGGDGKPGVERTPDAPGSGRGSSMPFRSWGNDLSTMLAGGAAINETEAPGGKKAGSGGKAGHAGYDFAIGDRGKGGDRVYNPFPGAKVLKAGMDPTGYGNMVKLRTPSGHTVILGHLETIAVSEGQMLSRGTLIGTEGNTGNADGYHLHVEIREPGKDSMAQSIRDPQAFQAAYAQMASAPAPAMGSNGQISSTPSAATPTGSSGRGAISRPDQDPAFAQGLNDLGKRTGLKPSDLAFVMGVETNGTFNPAQKGGTSNAMGLLQFMPMIAKKLGTSTAELAKMTRTEQLKYVEKYFAMKQDFRNDRYDGLSIGQAIGKAGGGIEETYLGVFAPAFVGSSGNTTIYSGATAKRQAKDFDVNKDGSIQKWELAQALQERAKQSGADPYSSNGMIRVEINMNGNVTVSGQPGPGDSKIKAGGQQIAQGVAENAAAMPTNKKGSR